MNERIDLLAVLNTAERSIIGAGSSEFRPAMREAIAAVAELIEAHRKAHDAMLLADWNVPGLCSERQHAAYLASTAALARIGSP